MEASIWMSADLDITAAPHELAGALVVENGNEIHSVSKIDGAPGLMLTFPNRKALVALKLEVDALLAEMT